jgi:N-succinyldiaminopimelate aminotransferase
MNPVIQQASIAAWSDETHVVGNRDKYRAKFAKVTPMLAEVMNVALPNAGFYLWADVSAITTRRNGRSDRKGDDIAFAQSLLGQYNVVVLPGSLLARESHGVNPGAGRIRLALVAEIDECVEAARRIQLFVRSNTIQSH